MSHPDQMTLHQLVDGELSERKARQVRDHLDGCDECARALEATTSLGDLLRFSVEDAADEALLDTITDRVMEGIREPAPPGLWERMTTWFSEFGRYRKKVWIPPLAAASAAAVAAVIVVGVDGPPPPQFDLRPGSNVLSVSFGTEVDGALFQLEGKDGSTTAVIWVDEGEPDPQPEAKRT